VTVLPTIKGSSVLHCIVAWDRIGAFLYTHSKALLGWSEHLERCYGFDSWGPQECLEAALGARIETDIVQSHTRINATATFLALVNPTAYFCTFQVPR
jgi:hypothetical protein